ncbi:MAG: hypothetical protein JWP12_3193 [Bacteroidetes bacterium]|nr:hypothetical protein [Bacteroidota bacterium]
MNKILILVSVVILCSCNTNSDPATTAAITKPVENITATKDQQERRKQSEEYCKRNNIPVYSNPNAMFVDPEAAITIRTRDEIVDRALALCYMGLKSEGLEQEHLDKLDKDFNISAKFSAKEKEYADAKKPSEQQTADANWRYESLHVMLWALGYIDSLSYPGEMCNVANDVKIIHSLTEKQFREKAKLRSEKEILDQADLVYRLDWACVDARVKKKQAPGKLNSEVVYERHYSLNWLIKYMDQDWDDVSTDT